ncbi:hypothetical protein SH501x_001469 [Pirellulaceae bacterium SH501]
MSPNLKAKPARSPKVPSPAQDPSIVIFRWGMLVVGALLVVASLVLKMEPSLLPKGSAAASELLAKVGLVFISAWIAWPAIAAVKEAPGGMLVLVGGFATVMLFVMRPRTIYLTGPFILIAAVLAILVGWIRRLRD